MTAQTVAASDSPSATSRSSGSTRRNQRRGTCQARSGLVRRACRARRASGPARPPRAPAARAATNASAKRSGRSAQKSSSASCARTAVRQGLTRVTPSTSSTCACSPSTGSGGDQGGSDDRLLEGLRGRGDSDAPAGDVVLPVLALRAVERGERLVHPQARDEDGHSASSHAEPGEADSCGAHTSPDRCHRLTRAASSQG